MSTTRATQATAVAEQLARVAVSTVPSAPLGPAMSQVVKRLLSDGVLDEDAARDLWRAIGFVQLPELFGPVYSDLVVAELAQGIEQRATSLGVAELRALVRELNRRSGDRSVGTSKRSRTGEPKG